MKTLPGQRQVLEIGYREDHDLVPQKFDVNLILHPSLSFQCKTQGGKKTWTWVLMTN